MQKAVRIIPAVLASVALLLTGQSSHAAVGDDSGARASVKADAFWCYGTFEVVNRISFGGAGWIQETGVRSDGARSVRVYHPSGRSDEYRFRFSNGVVQGYLFGSENCVVLNPGNTVRPEARNGGQWWEGQWRTG